MADGRIIDCPDEPGGNIESKFLPLDSTLQGEATKARIGQVFYELDSKYGVYSKDAKIYYHPSELPANAGIGELGFVEFDAKLTLYRKESTGWINKGVLADYQWISDSVSSLEQRKEDKNQKGLPNGYAPLGADRKIPEIYLPDDWGGGGGGDGIPSIHNKWTGAGLVGSIQNNASFYIEGKGVIKAEGNNNPILQLIPSNSNVVSCEIRAYTGESFAVGRNAATTGNEAVAIGGNATAGAGAVSAGHGAKSFYKAIAIGNNAEASSYYSTAIGDGAKSDKQDALQLGRGAIAAGSDILLQILDYPLLDDAGKIPTERIPQNIIDDIDDIKDVLAITSIIEASMSDVSPSDWYTIGEFPVHLAPKGNLTIETTYSGGVSQFGVMFYSNAGGSRDYSMSQTFNSMGAGVGIGHISQIRMIRASSNTKTTIDIKFASNRPSQTIKATAVFSNITLIQPVINTDSPIFEEKILNNYNLSKVKAGEYNRVIVSDDGSILEGFNDNDIAKLDKEYQTGTIYSTQSVTDFIPVQRPESPSENQTHIQFNKDPLIGSIMAFKNLIVDPYFKRGGIGNVDSFFEGYGELEYITNTYNIGDSPFLLKSATTNFSNPDYPFCIASLGGVYELWADDPRFSRSGRSLFICLLIRYLGEGEADVNINGYYDQSPRWLNQTKSKADKHFRWIVRSVELGAVNPPGDLMIDILSSSGGEFEIAYMGAHDASAPLAGFVSDNILTLKEYAGVLGGACAPVKGSLYDCNFERGFNGFETIGVGVSANRITANDSPNPNGDVLRVITTGNIAHPLYTQGGIARNLITPMRGASILFSVIAKVPIGKYCDFQLYPLFAPVPNAIKEEMALKIGTGKYEKYSCIYHFQEDTTALVTPSFVILNIRGGDTGYSPTDFFVAKAEIYDLAKDAATGMSADFRALRQEFEGQILEMKEEIAHLKSTI